ncbi:thymidine phosphorylase family protein [Orrella sp. 11846]|uniref:thymidine phosphorylase family protein n=1 Tax=Orrella sp. 11846 TaxID=3409913 RepID=UPI003B5C6435
MADTTLKYKELGIDTMQEYVAFLQMDCHIVRSEGIQAQTRVELIACNIRIVATVNVIHSDMIECGEIGLSMSAQAALGVQEGDEIIVAQAPVMDSLSEVRGKIYGVQIDRHGFDAIIKDISKGRYTDIHIAAFLTAMAAHPPVIQEITDLTAAMVDVGEYLDWGATPVADKHCVGGLPGNRTTPIVVAIMAACGVTMPKTSSRAITSPAGTADVMEVVTPVDLSVEDMKRVVQEQGGCLVWGGALALSPADDLLIRVARPLELDSDAQLVASVLSKKIAAGATHVVIDIPVGPTAKIRTQEQAIHLEKVLTEVAFANGLHLRAIRTDGRAPVGRGIGPALEARDVLKVLRCEADAPQDLRERALKIAAELLEFCEIVKPGQGMLHAVSILDQGKALERFMAICEAQGGFTEPQTAPIQHLVRANQSGVIRDVHNRRLSRLAKLLGAPEAQMAGIDLHANFKDTVALGDPLFTLHAQAWGEMEYAKTYLETHPLFLIEASD